MKTIIIKNSINELSKSEVVNLMIEISSAKSINKLKKFTVIENIYDSFMMKHSLFDELSNKFNCFSNDYKIDVMSANDLSELIFSFENKNTVNINFEKIIHYFNYSDLNYYLSPSEYKESLKFVVAYNEENILGILKFAMFSGKPSISYCSVNKLYKSHGISKKLLEKFFEYYSSTYLNKKLILTGYSVDGWKFLRKTILSLKEKYNISMSERPIEYCGENGYLHTDYILIDESKEEIKKLYGEIY